MHAEGDGFARQAREVVAAAGDHVGDVVVDAGHVGEHFQHFVEALVTLRGDDAAEGQQDAAVLQVIARSQRFVLRPDAVVGGADGVGQQMDRAFVVRPAGETVAGDLADGDDGAGAVKKAVGERIAQRLPRFDAVDEEEGMARDETGDGKEVHVGADDEVEFRAARDAPQRPHVRQPPTCRLGDA